MTIRCRPVTTPAEWLEWRAANVNASEVGALFGLHPHVTILDLWALKSRLLPQTGKADTAAMRRGRIMEPSVARAVKEERPQWSIYECRMYYDDANKRIGATPDFMVRRPDRKLPGILQAKTVSPRVFEEQWTEDQPPFWIVLQAQVEMFLSGSQWGIVAPLIVDGWHFDCAIYEVERHEPTWKLIEAAVANFWKSVEAGVQPATDFDRDGKLLAALFPRERFELPELDLSTDNRMPTLIAEYVKANADIREAHARRRRVSAEMKSKLGDHEAAFGDGWRVTWKTIHRDVKLQPAISYRQIRVAAKKFMKQIGVLNGEEPSGPEVDF